MNRQMLHLRGVRQWQWLSRWDALGGLLAVSLAGYVLIAAQGAPGFRQPDALGALITAIGAATVATARRWPLTALLVCSGCATLAALLDYKVDVLPFLVALLLFATGYYRSLRRATVVLSATAALFAITAASQPEDLGLLAVLQTTTIFVVSWLLGRLLRVRRDALLALVDAAEQRAAGERDRAALSLVEQRLRIARELHDVLTHSVSVISVQATVGEHLAANDPDAARRALSVIGEVSRSSMQELRQLVTLLRDEATAEVSGEGPAEPVRRLADLPHLLDTYIGAGLDVHYRTRGAPRPVSPLAELCSYRIVQEALTNTLKHAAATRAEVMVDYGPSAVELTVSDDGPGSSNGVPPGQGHGLAGMRERTALLGGTLHVGAGATGGFEVRARFPYELP